VYNQPPRSIQPGHPSVGRRDEYQLKLRNKHAHRAYTSCNHKFHGVSLSQGRKHTGHPWQRRQTNKRTVKQTDGEHYRVKPLLCGDDSITGHSLPSPPSCPPLSHFPFPSQTQVGVWGRAAIAVVMCVCVCLCVFELQHTDARY